MNLAKLISFANCSASSLYGCIGYSVQDLILSKFPKDFFKAMTMSSELATRNIRRNFKSENSNNEMVKRLKPYIVIQPTYAAMQNDDVMQGIPLTKNMDNLQYRTDKRYLFEVVRDNTYGYSMKFRMNRDRIEFDIQLVFETLHTQIDTYKAIQNQMIWDIPFAYTCALEAIIPKRLIAMMSKLSHMDIETNSEYIPAMISRLNKTSVYPITYKLRNASATDEWFMYYTHNIILTFSDLNLESPQRKSMIEDHFGITFKVTAEFNMPAVYFLEGIPEKIKGIDITLKTKEYNEWNDAFIPLYTIDNLFVKYPPERNGKQLYGSAVFRTEKAHDTMLEERINLKSILDNDHIRVLRVRNRWKLPPETIMDVIVLKHKEELIYEEDYYIDWNKLELVMKNPHSDITYRIVIYFNYGKVNEILSNTEYYNTVNDDISFINPNNVKEDEIIMLPQVDINDIKIKSKLPIKDQIVESTDEKKKLEIIEMINNNASVGDIFNARQSVKKHIEDEKIPLPKSIPPTTIIEDPITEVEVEKPKGKKKYTSSAKR